MHSFDLLYLILYKDCNEQIGLLVYLRVKEMKIETTFFRFSLAAL